VSFRQIRVEGDRCVSVDRVLTGSFSGESPCITRSYAQRLEFTRANCAFFCIGVPHTFLNASIVGEATEGHMIFCRQCHPVLRVALSPLCMEVGLPGVKHAEWEQSPRNPGIRPPAFPDSCPGTQTTA
jgi:hypothetical protein